MRKHFVANPLRRFAAGLLLCLFTTLPPAPFGAVAAETPAFTHPYGVFIGCEPSQAARFAPYQTVVIDAAYFTAEEITALHKAGHTVFSYLNIGSLEDFRPYYDRFCDQTLAPYENWEGERWMNVADTGWQTYVTGTLAADLIRKGVDGFFVDNCDVYYLYPTEAMFLGLTAILQPLRASGLSVVINGGDTYVTAYAQRFGTLAGILTGVNQESVFSSIDFDRGVFGHAAPDDRDYFTAYLQQVAALGGTVYLLEYTADTALIEEIAAYCEQQGYLYYIADSLELV